uniref:tetratricopeptide repeat-containing sensor histidine kinase n=1 Tax=Gelidibacter sp. TaxID=2018083 RepID=UPI004049D948
MNYSSPIVALIAILYLCLSVSVSGQTASTDSLNYYRQVVNQPQSAEQLVKAYTFFEQHLQLAKHKKDLSTVAHDRFQLGRIHYYGGFYNESEIMTINALQLVDQLPEDDYSKALRKSIYNQLGMLYREQQHTDKALKLYTTSLGFAKNAFDSVTIYNNRSNTYKDVKDYTTAKSELQKAYDLLPRLTDTLNQAMVLDNMGYLNFQLKDTSALTLFHRALELRLLVGDTVKTFSSYYNLAAYYQDKDSTKAREYASKAFTLSKTLNNPYYQEEALGVLASLDPQRYFLPYKNLSDSIAVAKQLVQNRFATLKYDVSKSELMAEREKAKRIRYQIIFLIALSLSLLAMVWIRARAKKKRLLHVYDTETRISKKVHDEIANDLYQVMSYIQTTAKPNEALLDDLETIYNKTRDISKEHNNIALDEGFDQILQDLLRSYKRPETTINTLNCDKVNWQKMSIIKKYAIYRVLQELMTNMKKHSDATHVVVTFSQRGSRVHIVYKDNGKGCELHKQTGLQNAENRIKAIKGTITFDSEPHKGFQATLLI